MKIYYSLLPFWNGKSICLMWYNRFSGQTSHFNKGADTMSTKLTVQTPRIPGGLEHIHVDEHLQNKDSISLGTIEDCEIAEISADKTTIEQVVFKNVNFLDVTLTSA